MNIPASFRLSAALLLVAITSVSLPGCVGRRQAVLANEALKASSREAAKAVDQLHANVAKEVDAHLSARKQLRSAVTQAVSARREAALQRMDAALQRALTDIATTNAALLAQLASAHHDRMLDLEKAIDAALQPLQQKADEAKKQADAAFAEFKSAPNELTFRQNLILADKNYLAIQGVVIDIRLDALKAGLQEMDQVAAATRERLAAAAGRHAAACVDRYQRAVANLPSDASFAVELGPDPAMPEAEFAGLKAYTASVEKAADSNLDYLNSNSFGSGSFFRDFFRSFGQGVVTAVANPSARSLDTSGVLKDASALGNDLLGELKQNLNDAVSGFKLEGGSVLTDTTAALADKAKKAVESFVQGKINRLGDRTGDPGKTSNP
jgi:hypothetical protein